MSSSKRSLNILPIRAKVELLNKLDEGTPVKQLCDLYKVGASTVYDLKRQKEKIRKFYVENESNKDRKRMREEKNERHDILKDERTSPDEEMMVDQFIGQYTPDLVWGENSDCNGNAGYGDFESDRRFVELLTPITQLFIDEDKKCNDDGSHVSISNFKSLLSAPVRQNSIVIEPEVIDLDLIEDTPMQQEVINLDLVEDKPKQQEIIELDLAEDKPMQPKVPCKKQMKITDMFGMVKGKSTSK